MKKHNERGAGRKMEGETKKIHKSICLEQHQIDAIMEDFPKFSKGIQFLINNYIKEKSK